MPGGMLKLRYDWYISDTQTASFESSIQHAYVLNSHFKSQILPEIVESLFYVAKIHLQKLFSAYAGLISAALSSTVFSTRYWHRYNTKIAIELVTNVTQLKL